MLDPANLANLYDASRDIIALCERRRAVRRLPAKAFAIMMDSALALARKSIGGRALSKAHALTLLHGVASVVVDTASILGDTSIKLPSAQRRRWESRLADYVREMDMLAGIAVPHRRDW